MGILPLTISVLGIDPLFKVLAKSEFQIGRVANKDPAEARRLCSSLSVSPNRLPVFILQCALSVANKIFWIRLWLKRHLGTCFSRYRGIEKVNSNSKDYPYRCIKSTSITCQEGTENCGFFKFTMGGEMRGPWTLR